MFYISSTGIAGKQNKKIFQELVSLFLPTVSVSLNKRYYLFIYTPLQGCPCTYLQPYRTVKTRGTEIHHACPSSQCAVGPVFMLCVGPKGTKEHPAPCHGSGFVPDSQLTTFLSNRELKRIWSGKNHGALLYHRAVPGNNLSLYLKVIMKQMYLLGYWK